MSVQTGTALWASILNPNTKFDPQYCINLVVDEDVAKEYQAKGFPVKEFDEGLALVIRRYVTSKAGKTNPTPKLYDKSKNPIDVAIGNGSRVNVQYKEWESQRRDSNGNFFKGFDLIAVQVLDLVSYNEAGDEFDIEESLEEEDEL